MTGAAGQSIVGGFTAPSRAEAGAPAERLDHAAGKNRAVLIYLLLAVAAVLPGLAAKFADKSAGRGFVLIRSALDDIKFGSGLRFWLGVAGASILALLLFYPLRKIFGGTRRIGSIGAWFHVHMALGLLGPVLLLYHCNFSLGSRNANVALWAMLLIVASGFAGHLVYARVSADFYAEKRAARGHLDAIRALIEGLETPENLAARLLDELEQFDARQLTPRQGLLAVLRNRLKVEDDGRQLSRGLAWVIAEAARVQGLSAAEHAQRRRAVATPFRDYVRIVRRGAGRSLREQLWARWRLFHLPLFMIMAIAAGLHVATVWNAGDSAGQVKAPEAARSAPKRVAGVQHQAPRTSRAPAVEAPQRSPKPGAAPPIPSPVPAAKREPGPQLVAPPQRVAPPASRTIEAAAPVQGSTKGAAAKSGGGTGEAQAAKSAAPPEHVVQSNLSAKPVPQPATSAPAPSADMTTVYSELQRKTETQPMALGGAKPRSLSEQIELYKAKIKAKQFAHSEAETGFVKTGKHASAECVSCHVKPMRDARQPNPRQCIDCHKEDDVHRGKRPECASCHTANRWNEITRRP